MSADERTPDGESRPQPLDIAMSVTQCVDQAFVSAAAGRLRRAVRTLAAELIARPGALVGLSIDAPLLACGTGAVALTPLLRGGYVDWISTTGANLYMDALGALGAGFTDREPPDGEEGWLRCGEAWWARADALQAAERALGEILALPSFQSAMGSAELHALLGAQLHAREKQLGVEQPALLSTAQELDVPVYNPAPADNPLGALIAQLALVGNRLLLDASVDLNEAAAILNAALKTDPVAVIWSLGEGPAAGFLRGVPRQLDAALDSPPTHAYRLAVRVASDRPSHRGDPRAAAPAEEVLVDTDLSVALPLMAAYLLDRVPPRPLKRLCERRDELLDRMRQDRLQTALRRPLERLVEPERRGSSGA